MSRIHSTALIVARSSRSPALDRFGRTVPLDRSTQMP